MNKPLVSIVLPVYNVEKYLNRCIETIANQTYKNIEILLIDDGSTDRSGKLCDCWRDSDNRIKVIHKINQGLGMARNTGIDYAQGKYICFFDSDDYIEINTIEECVNKMESENSDIICFGLNEIDKKGNIKKVFIPKTKLDFYENRDVQNILVPEIIGPNQETGESANLRLSAWSFMYSSVLIHNINFRFVSERGIISEDVYSLLELFSRVQKASIIRKAFYNYCDNESSLSRVFRNDRYNKIKRFYFEVTELCKRLEYSSEVCKRLDGIYLSFAIAALKQVIESDLSLGNKIEYVKSIVEDDLLGKVLSNFNDTNENKMRKLLHKILRKKSNFLTYALISSKIKMDSFRFK